MARHSSYCAGRFTVLEPINPSIDVSELHKVVYIYIFRLRICEMFGQVTSRVQNLNLMMLQLTLCLSFVKRHLDSRAYVNYRCTLLPLSCAD